VKVKKRHLVVIVVVTQCTYNSEDCSANASVNAFERIPTDMGFCFSFNSGAFYSFGCRWI